MTDRLDRWADPPLLVLASLADEPKHGYAITQDVAETMGVRLSAGTLYAVIARLDQAARLQPGNHGIECARAEADAHCLRHVLGDGVAMLGLVGQAGQHQQRRIGPSVQSVCHAVDSITPHAIPQGDIAWDVIEAADRILVG